MNNLKRLLVGASTVTTTMLLAVPNVLAQSYEWEYSTTADESEGIFALFTGLGLLCWIPMCLVSLVFTAFWFWMLFDVIKRDEKVLPGKIKWILLMVFTGTIGAAVYYFTRKRKFEN